MDVDERGVHAAERLIHSVSPEETAAALDAVRARGDAPTGPGSPTPHRRTLVIAAELGWFHYAIECAFVRPGRRFSAGERIERPDYVAEIRSTSSDGRPLEVAFRFHVPLESPELRWLYWQNDRLIPFPLPAVGTGVSVPRGIYTPVTRR